MTPGAVLAVLFAVVATMPEVAWEACPAAGNDYWAAGEHDAASDSYRRCRDLEPGNPDHLFALALALEHLD